MIFIGIMALCALVCAGVASARGLNPIAWAAWGAVGGLFAVAAVCAVPRGRSK